MNQAKLSVEEQERAIESKQALLAYLRSCPKKMSIESYLCLAGLLTKAGWQSEGGEWRKAGMTLSLFAAAVQELVQQLQTDKDRLLSQTVANYRRTPRRQSAWPGNHQEADSSGLTSH